MPRVSIAAHGTSTIFRQAERAVVHVRVASEGTSQERVSKEVTLAAAELRAILKSLSPKTENGEATPDAAVTYWKNSTLSTGSYLPVDDKGKKLDRQYTSQTTFEIKFRDFERLSILIADLSIRPHVEITLIEWRLTDATKAGLASHSRKEAIEDAVVKARDYAAVLGRGKPEAVEVIDSSSSYGSYTPVRGRMDEHGAYRTQRQQKTEFLDVEPESVQLNCNITVKFVAD